VQGQLQRVTTRSMHKLLCQWRSVVDHLHGQDELDLMSIAAV
jgi:hypothetical protein